MAAPATPSAHFKMVSVPAAQEQVLQETQHLPPVTVPFHQALQHVIAEDVLAQEPVPGFRASIKVRSKAAVSQGSPGSGRCRPPARRWQQPRQLPLHSFPRSLLQDGYAVVSSDGPGEYEVAFEAFAGAPPRTLSPGAVAYIGTGAAGSSSVMLGAWVAFGQL